MAWRRPSHRLKSPTTLTRLAAGANTAKATPDTPSSTIGMGAELFVEMHVRPFAEQVEIEIGQDRREAVGVFDLDLPFAVARAQAVAARSVGQATLEQTGVMNALEIAFVALFVDDGDAFRIRKEDANDG